MTDQTTPTIDDLREIAEQVWSAYLDPEGIQPLLLGEVGEAPTAVSASVSLTGAWHGHVVVTCSATAARHAAAAFLAMSSEEVSDEDHDGLEAADGRQAHDSVLSEKPDLVVSDWNMPQMTGMQVLNALRAAGNAVPFGFVTSECTKEMQNAAEAAGALFFIVKPFTPERFQEALRPVLG